jgi:blocked-early-in-transport protein 1
MARPFVSSRLASKAGQLKSLAFEMEGEAKDHHKLLDGLEDGFDSTGGFLGNTLNRVKLMTQTGRGNRKVMCYVSVGVVFAFFVFYWIISKMANKLMAEGSAPSTPQAGSI